MAQSMGIAPIHESESSPFLFHLLAVAQDPFGVLRRRWYWMLLAFVLVCMATAGAYVLRTPNFEASATVIVSSQQIPEDFVRSTVTGLDSMAEINSLLGEAFSQKFLLELIDENGLYRGLDSVTAATLMRQSIGVRPQNNLIGRGRQNQDASIIIGISYSASRSELAASITNRLAGNIVDASIERRGAQARGTTLFLSRELNSAEREMADIDSEIQAFRDSNRGEMPADLETLLRKLERMDLQRVSLREQITATQERLTQLENAVGVESSPQAVLGNLRLQLAQQLALHTDEHPNVLSLRRQISAMENDMGELNRLLLNSDANSQDLAASAQRELTALQDSLNETTQAIEDLDARVGRIPNTSDALRALEEKATVSRENYLDLLRKVQDAELAETLESAQQGPTVSVLDAATPPVAPTNSRLKYLLLGAVASVVLALGAGLIMEVIDPVVLNRSQLESLGGPPILGSFGRMG